MSSISSIIAQNNPYEKFVQQLVQIESRTKRGLQAQQSAQRERKTALGDVQTAVKRFADNLEGIRKSDTNVFSPFKSSVSNDSLVRINGSSTLNSAAVFGLQTERLASRDIALTEVMSREGNTLSGTGEGSITITIGERTETISIDTTDKNDAEVLEALAAGINEQFGNELSASLFNVNSGNVQFSMKSGETGFENRIQIGDITGDLSGLDFSKLVEDPTELDARFTIDGVTFERSSNTIDDAIEGLNFTLLRASDEVVTMDVQHDTEAARKKFDEFVSAFNNVNKTIRDRTFLDAEGDRRGPLQNMRTVRNLTVSLRQMAILPNGEFKEGGINRISDMGIEFEKNGTMVVRDSTKLNEWLERDPDAVMEFFTNDDSPISSMLAEAQSYSKDRDGLIASLKDGVDQRISNLDRRIQQQERFLAQYEERQRAEFNRLQLIIDQGVQQFNEIMAYQGMFRF